MDMWYLTACITIMNSDDILI